MSNGSWEHHLNLVVAEIHAMSDPWERVMAAEAARAVAMGMLNEAVDFETYRLKQQTLATYKEMAHRLLANRKTMEERVLRWCFRNGVDTPVRGRIDPTPDAIDLTHLNTFHWRHLRRR